MNESIHITQMNSSDWPVVSKIYKEGIETGMATFETEVPTYESWNASHINSLRFVAKIDETIIGWVALSPVSSRCVYGGVAEISVYVTKSHYGKGIGSLLVQHIIGESEKSGYWTIQSGIFPENKASIAIHQKNGFRIIGFREKIGKLENEWKDNIILERRSKKIGIN